YEIRELVPGERLVMSTAQGPFPMETTYGFEDAPAGATRMTLRNRGEPAGFARVAAPVMARAMRRANGRALRGLRALRVRGPGARGRRGGPPVGSASRTSMRGKPPRDRGASWSRV